MDFFNSASRISILTFSTSFLNHSSNVIRDVHEIITSSLTPSKTKMTGEDPEYARIAAALTSNNA